MKKLLCIILAIAMMVCFTACGKETPEKAADNALKAVKSLNIVKMEKYFDEALVDDMDLDDISVEELKIVKKYLSKMSWEIIDSVEEENKATVTVRLSIVDFTPILKELADELFEDTLSSLFGDKKDDGKIEEKTFKIINDMLSQKDVAMTTDYVELDMTLTENGWKIEFDSSLIGYFFEGMDFLV